MRKFDSGATRDKDDTKIDPEGFISPVVVKLFSEYMTRHRVQADGELRDSDNWQKGIPGSAYMKSLARHFLDAWLMHRGFEPKTPGATWMDSLCGVMFNAMGLMFETAKGRITL